MMKQQIKKLCKQLKRFNFDDILSILEFPENEVQKILQELISEKFISQLTKTEYAYVPNIISNLQIELLPQNQEIKAYKSEPTFNIEALLAKHEDQQKIFDNATEYNKRHIIKCLNLFKLTNGLAGKEIIKILKDIAKENPDYKMGYSTYLKWKSAYFRKGLTGLLKAYPPPKNKSLATKELLDEFEKIYLTPKRYSARIAWEILKTKYPDKQIPSVQSFHRAINKAYSQEYINKKRSECFKLPELDTTSSTKTNKITYEKVKDALNDYLKQLEDKKDETSVCSKGYIKNHLYPYWSKYNFKDITQEKLINFQSKMLANGYSISSIKRFVSLLQKIIKKYSKNDNLRFSTQDTILPSLENKVLTDKEIKQIIKDDTRIQELWILATGLNTAELGAIEYSDINFQNKTVSITKVKYKDKIENIRAKYKIRILKIPSVLFNKIPQNKVGYLFKEIEINNFDILLNTHIKLMLNKNVQINIISRNLGFYKLTEFENRYNFLLPQELEDNFQIL